MLPINVITALVVLCFCAMVIRAFWPLMGRHLGEFGYFATRGIVLLMAVAMLRSGYWDFGQYLLGDDWLSVARALGGQKFSAVFNVLMLPAFRDFLKARQALIPAEERAGWPWWKTWNHPYRSCIIDWGRKK